MNVDLNRWVADLLRNAHERKQGTEIVTALQGAIQSGTHQTIRQLERLAKDETEWFVAVRILAFEALTGGDKGHDGDTRWLAAEDVMRSFLTSSKDELRFAAVDGLLGWLPAASRKQLESYVRHLASDGEPDAGVREAAAYALSEEPEWF